MRSAIAVIVLSAAAPCAGQWGPATATAYIRERTNATQWFSAAPSPAQYGYQESLLRLGIQQRVGHFDYQLELGQSAEIALPPDAVSAATAQGQLGLGGTYYASNGNNQNPAVASLRSGVLRYHFNTEANTLQVGRFEFIEGQEINPADKTLAWLQTNRIAQRLVGNFGFSNGQRSFDGLEAKLVLGQSDVTLMAGRATQGAYNMNANPELNVDIQYLAYTRSFAKQHTVVRGFALGYHDGRTGIAKTDNRALAVRQGDHRSIRIGSYGADVISAIPTGKNTVDVLFWGVLQNGQWGALDQHSGGLTVEAGLKFDHVVSKPWIRGGMLRTTGDNEPSDGAHNTFFQILPTPRIYARYPFFNSMNSKDQFIQLIDNPSAKVELRTDMHFLQLTSPLDLWYQGGGAFDNKVFGYTGRPANGHASFSSVYDISADYALNPHVSLGLYYAHAFGNSAVGSIYNSDRDSNYGYFELMYRFRKVFSKPAPKS